MTITSKFRTAVAGALAGAIGLLAAGPAHAGIVFGGTGKSDCYAAISVEGIDAGSARVEKNRKVLCTDGEACDTGACGDGVCNLRVAACINQPGLAQCTPPAGLKRLKVKGKLNVGIPQLLEGSACGSFLDVTVATKKGGKKVGKAKVAVQAKALKGTKPASDSDNFELQCLPRTVACPPPTTTTTTIIVTPTTTTTTLPLCGNSTLDQGELCDGALGSCPGGAACSAECTCPSDFVLDFTVLSQPGSCGRIENGSGVKIADLGCGGLNIGSGNAAAPAEGPTPDGSTNRFSLSACAGDVCQVQQSSQDPAAAANGIDCTAPGCPFGIPLPIEGAPTTCVLNSFATPASGSFNLATGTTETLNVNLSSLIYGGGSYLTSDGTTDIPKPCPVCVDSIDQMAFPNSFRPVAGTPAAPATGVCNGGPRTGQACTTRNSQGLTHDCQPGGNAVIGGELVQPTRPCAKDEDCRDSLNQQVNNIGSIPVNLSPLKTSTVTVTRADGLFCPEQDAVNGAGCFGAEVGEQGQSGSDCRTIVSIGSPFGSLTGGQPGNGVLASVFCIPRTNSVVDLAANLPGPGQVTLPGTMKVSSLSGSPSGAFLD
jgi:hypothetical protein